MLKHYLSNQTKRSQRISLVLIVLIVASIGTYILTASHAATPYASTNAVSGTLANGANIQTCSGASNGNCVVFRGTTGGIASGSIINPACTPSWGSFGGGVYPPACWRLYSATNSPFNRPISANPTVLPNSSSIVSSLSVFSQTDPNNTPLQLIAAGPGATTGYGTGGFPTYYSHPADPLFTISCTGPNADSSICTLNGQQLRIPQAALAASNSDSHMTVIDQSTGTEYDFWQAKTPLPQGGGTLVVSGSGKTSVDGDGLGSHAIAAGYGALAGVIRAQEMQAGQINHALVMFVKCDSGSFVYPATASDYICSKIGLPTTNAPMMGARFQLNMTDSQITALSAATWQKTILRALAHYGAYVSDTGGEWGFQVEGSTQYNSLGYSDPWRAFAQANGWTYNSSDGTYLGNLTKAVDWYNNLRVLDPCSSKGSC